MIMSQEWLIKTRKAAGLTQSELANRSGISIGALRNIEQGQRIGSVDTLEKLNSALGTISISFECSDFIEELEEEISLYGPECKCHLYYKLKDGIVLFIDYALDRDLEDRDFEPLPGETMVEGTLQQALDIFTYQSKILK